MNYIIRAEHKRHPGLFAHYRTSPSSGAPIWRYGIGVTHNNDHEGVVERAEAKVMSLVEAVATYGIIMAAHDPKNSWLKEISIVAVEETK